MLELEQKYFHNCLFCERRLPNAAFIIVSNGFLVDVDAVPFVVFLVAATQLIEDLNPVQAGIEAQLLWNDLKKANKFLRCERARARACCEICLKRLGIGFPEKLLLTRNRFGCIAQMFAQLHFDGAAAGNNRVVLLCAPNNHNRVVQRALRLGDKLLSAAAQNERARARRGAALEHIEAVIDENSGNLLRETHKPLAADLLFVERLTSAKNIVRNVGDCRERCAAARRLNAIHIIFGNAASAKQISRRFCHFATPLL